MIIVKVANSDRTTKQRFARSCP